ncbi:hypothetical protein PBY51_005692 [Eleginops maclovinus]|uniref:Secreted protein n=1 Tax=Eleginops maclovinus TaxID=56733 RepID=A0AAN8AAP9_ELEMC|nr:hypothetical protein PBY51_005692 [Eleginops maclovinus]
MLLLCRSFATFIRCMADMVQGSGRGGEGVWKTVPERSRTRVCRRAGTGEKTSRRRRVSAGLKRLTVSSS